MRIFFLPLFAIMLGLSVQAQNDAPLFRKHAVGVNFSNDVTSIFRNYDIEPEQEFRLKYGYTAAAMYQLRLSKLISLEMGVEITSTAYYLHDDIDDRILNAAECHTLSCFFKQAGGERINNIVLPVNVKGNYQVNRLNFYGQAGILLYGGFGGTYYFRDGDILRSNIKFGEGAFFEGMGLGLSTAIGIEYSLGARIMLKAEPRLRVYDLLRVKRYGAHSDFVREYPWAFGLNLGVYYQLGK